jgi:sulfide:quinone oxidoreductase
MRSRIVILGGGTAGTLVANRLVRRLGDSVDVTVVDQDDSHVYQPGLLFVPFGRANPEDLSRSRRRQMDDAVRFVPSGVDSVDLAANRVTLSDHEDLDYDVLVIASGARLVPEETEGLTGPGWNDRVFTFYTPEGAAGLQRAVRDFSGGRIVVNVVDLPIKCPVAPLEFAFLADWYFHQRGLRDHVELVYVTPLDGAFTKPVASAHLGGLLRAKGIDLVTEFNTGRVDGEARRLVGYDGRSVDFDLAVVVPLHSGAEYVGRSAGLGDELDFVPVDEQTLQSKAAPNVFAVGDAAALPTSKAGSVAHYEGDLLVENIDRLIHDLPLSGRFDGHTNCFIESGFGKAMLIDFNYDTEPLPGHFPSTLGLPLLRESRLNHLAKLGFEWFYWHVLLPGRDLPGLGSAMPTRGKPGLAGAGLKED